MVHLRDVLSLFTLLRYSYNEVLMRGRVLFTFFPYPAPRLE
jgi:hypothetical protein